MALGGDRFESAAGLDTGSVPRLRGYRLPDLTTAAGTVLFVGLSVAWYSGWSGLSRIELFLAFAMLVHVPLALGVATPRDPGPHSRLSLLVILCQLPAALLAIAGFTTTPGTVQRLILVAPWAAVTATVGMIGA